MEEEKQEGVVLHGQCKSARHIVDGPRHTSPRINITPQEQSARDVSARKRKRKSAPAEQEQEGKGRVSPRGELPAQQEQAAADGPIPGPGARVSPNDGRSRGQPVKGRSAKRPPSASTEVASAEEQPSASSGM